MKNFDWILDGSRFFTIDDIVKIRFSSLSQHILEFDRLLAFFYSFDDASLKNKIRSQFTLYFSSCVNSKSSDGNITAFLTSFSLFVHAKVKYLKRNSFGRFPRKLSRLKSFTKSSILQISAKWKLFGFPPRIWGHDSIQTKMLEASSFNCENCGFEFRFK